MANNNLLHWADMIEKRATGLPNIPIDPEELKRIMSGLRPNIPFPPKVPLGNIAAILKDPTKAGIMLPPPPTGTNI